MDVRIVLFIVFVCLSFIGCASTFRSSSEDRLAVLVYGYSNSDVDVYGLKWSHHYDPSEAEAVLESCLEKSLFHNVSGLEVIPGEKFRRKVFPSFSRKESPRSYESIAMLLNHQEFRQRVSEIGVRYLALISGSTAHTQIVDELRLYIIGGEACCGDRGAAIAYFWGKNVWDNETSLGALVIDLETGGIVNNVRADDIDESSLGIYLYVPVGKWSMTETVSCQNLSRQIEETVLEMQKSVGSGSDESLTPERRRQ